MSTMSHHVAAVPDEQHIERWQRLHDERRSRVEQLGASETELPSGSRQESVNLASRMAAAAALREIDAALARMTCGRYGLCVTCYQELPASRLDAFPMASLCRSCDYNAQNCRIARGLTDRVATARVG